MNPFRHLVHHTWMFLQKVKNNGKLTQDPIIFLLRTSTVFLIVSSLSSLVEMHRHLGTHESTHIFMFKTPRNLKNKHYVLEPFRKHYRVNFWTKSINVLVPYSHSQSSSYSTHTNTLQTQTNVKT